MADRGKPTRVTGDIAIKVGKGRIWMLVLEGGSEASSMDFHDHATEASGDPIVGITAPFHADGDHSQSTVPLDFTSVGGIPFHTGIWCNWEGTGAVGYVWFE